MRKGLLYAAAILSVAYAVFLALGPGRGPALRDEMLQASTLMAAAEAAVRDCRAKAGVAIDAGSDPNGTGLIGLETSPITTSLGNLGAKRTTTNPNFAALVAALLDEAGVRPGDTIAVGASGSFPALIIAALSAARIMDLRVLLVTSLGASEWGANNPAFGWLDMADCLRNRGLLDVKPLAVAVGGEGDVGLDMKPEGRSYLRGMVAERGLALLDEPDLAADVAARLKLYDAAAAGRPIRAFVNIGGASANIGASAEVLKLRPGLAGPVAVPAPAERGVLQSMAERKVPVIHLLNVRGLCERYGMPWDPRPLPGPGAGNLKVRTSSPRKATIIGTGVYVLGMLILVGGALLERRKRPMDFRTV